MTFHFARLSKYDFGFFRSPGPGLGNLMFPIARSVIGAEIHGGVVVRPTLTQIKLGTLMRRERDFRFYSDVQRPRRWDEWQKFALAKVVRPVTENSEIGQNAVRVEYAGLGHYFHDLIGHRELVVSWFMGSFYSEPALPKFDIAIHIRLADFSVTKGPNAGHGILTDIKWYNDAFRYAKRLLKKQDLNVVVFTDEPEHPVLKDLSVPNYLIDDSKNAFFAMQKMSMAQLIITSRSTFSGWGVFLGNSMAIWNKDLDLASFWPHRAGLDFKL